MDEITHISQRDSPKIIKYPFVLVYDIMLPHLGNQYKINPKLNERLFRNLNFNSRKIACVDVLEDMGIKYLKEGKDNFLEKALECYRFSIWTRFRFSLEKKLNPNQIIPKNEKKFLNIESNFEKKLSSYLDKLNEKDKFDYYNWVDTLRSMHDDLNYQFASGTYNTIDFARLCFRLGRYNDGLNAIEKLTKNQTEYQKSQGDLLLALKKKAEREKSEQLIDVEYLKEKIKSNIIYMES
ncbi:MAG: hypothetical protein AB7V77_00330 [Candidatus Woesearchaeota archaeon]